MVILNKNNRVPDVFHACTGRLWHKFGYFKHFLCKNVVKDEIYMENLLKYKYINICNTMKFYL